jgi:hypothetical protein
VSPLPYIGKDYLHEGCGLLLDPEAAWPRLARATRKNITRSREHDLRFARRPGTPADLESLRSIWYDPEDPNLPDELGDDDIFILALDADDQVLGACLLLPVGNHLFLNNLAASPAGRSIAIQERLLWHCVETLSGQGYSYIDVGVSYRQSLYRFFRKFQTVAYPVIFNPPAVPPVIRPWPATFAHRLARDPDLAAAGEAQLRELLAGRPFTFVPDRDWAETILRGRRLPSIDVTVWLPELATDRRIGWVELPRIFPVAFGALLVGVELSDQVLWDEYGCLDTYKRELVYRVLAAEVPRLAEIVATRRANWRHLADRFALDDIRPRAVSQPIIETCSVLTGIDDEFAARLNRFGVEAPLGPDGIHLPVHQGLGPDELDYLYGIYRGVLNLCSEWTKTGVKAAFTD